MAVEFGTMREFEGRRVRMRFSDGLETVARLLSAVQDIEGEDHLIYDQVEWANDPREFASAFESTVYAEGDSLLSIEAMEEPRLRTAIELHDSYCLSIDPDGTRYGHVVLNAYVHRTLGEPGRGPGEGGMQHIRMIFSELRVEGHTSEFPIDIYEGLLRCGDTLLDNLIEYPARFVGKIELNFFSREGSETVIRGEALSILQEGYFRSVETVDGSWH